MGFLLKMKRIITDLRYKMSKKLKNARLSGNDFFMRKLMKCKNPIFHYSLALEYWSYIESF